MKSNPLTRWNKEYISFDNDGKLCKTTLNLLQRFVRVIGFYKNTRLAEVSKVAMAAVFKSSDYWNNVSKDEIKGLIKKDCKKKKVLYSPLSTLGKKQFGDNSVELSGKFDNDNIIFEVKLEKDGNKRSASFCIERNKGGIGGISELFETNFPKQHDFTENTDDDLAKYTYLFLASVLKSTKNLEELRMARESRVGSLEMAEHYKFTLKEESFVDPGKLPEGVTLSRENIAEYMETRKVLKGAKLSKEAATEALEIDKTVEKHFANNPITLDFFC